MRKTKFPATTTTTLTIPNFLNGINTSIDEGIQSLQYALDIRNFSFSDGALKNGIGYNNFVDTICKDAINKTNLKHQLEQIGSIERIFTFSAFNESSASKETKLLIINNQYQVYYINIYDELPELVKLNIQLTSTPTAVEYKLNNEDVIIISSETDNMFVWNGVSAPYEVLDSPKISSMAMHYERLFVTTNKEKNTIWFSDDLDPTNWNVNLDDAGYISLVDERGALIKVISFLDYIYIFREYGISRLSAFGSQADFSISNLFVSSGRIYPDSVCVCGDVILFLASDGIYRFDGISTTKILTNIENNISNITNQTTASCYYNGSYYLACKYNFLNDSNDITKDNFSNALLEIDVNTFKLKNISYGVNINYLTSIKTDKYSGVLALAKLYNSSNFYIVNLCNNAKFLNSNLEKSWISPYSNLGDISKNKTLKNILIETKTPIELSIFHDSTATTFTFEKGRKNIIKRTNLPLSEFAFKIVSKDESCLIRSLKFVFSSAAIIE